MLADHRLSRIDAIASQDRFSRFVGRNAHSGPQRYGAGNTIVRLTTDQGAQGWAACAAPAEELQPLIGARIADLIDPASGATELGMPLDQPLHDLAGRILDQPVYRLLGAQGPTRVPIYSGAIYLDDLEPENEPRGVAGIVASCQQDYEAGYRAFKLKIGRGAQWLEAEAGLQGDIDAVRAVRQHFPDCRILVDANDVYAPANFMRFLDGVADCDLYWIEEPFFENEDDLKRLKDHMARLGCTALIAEGEGRTQDGRAERPGPYGYYGMAHIDRLYDLAAKGLVDVFIIDLNIVGFTRWRRIMPQLVAAGIPAAPHTWCWCVRPCYVVQLGAGVGNVLCIEGIPGTSSALDYGHYPLVDGCMEVPDLPGFAMPLKPDANRS